MRLRERNQHFSQIRFEKKKQNEKLKEHNRRVEGEAGMQSSFRSFFTLLMLDLQNYFYSQ